MENIIVIKSKTFAIRIVKLSKYLNEYAAADEQSKDICKKLIKLEEELSVQMRDFL